jgi:high-affinity nickel-transport protein
MAERVRSTCSKNDSETERSGLQGRLVDICSILIFANVSSLVWALVDFTHQPVLIGTTVLVYSLGLRHAIDAEHIAAIDDFTRKLMLDGKRRVSVGFFFALGHSTAVVLASLAVALTANAFSDHLYLLPWDR